MKAKEMQLKPATELEAHLDKLKKDLFHLRMQHATKQLENPIQIRAVKRDIARVKTVLRDKERKSGGVN